MLPLLFDNLHYQILYIDSTARIIQCFIFILLLSLFLVFLYRVVLYYYYHIYIFCLYVI